MTSAARPDIQRHRYIITEPSSAAWNSFVRQHPQGHLLQLGPWGELKSAFGWHAQRMAVAEIRDTGMSPAAEDAHAPALLAGAQVLFRRRYGFSMAYVPRGPLLSGERAVDDMLLTALEQAARRQRAVFLRIEPDVLQDDPRADACHNWLLLKGFQAGDPIQPRSSIHVDVTPPPENVFAAFSKGHRADIRRAERRDVLVHIGTAEDISTFHAIMQDTGQRGAFGVHSEPYYRMAWEVFQPHSRLLLAEQNEQTVAAHLVFLDGQRGCYLYSGATEAGLKTGANHLLQWHAMQWAREQGCQRYDLWGIPDALGQAATAADEQQREILEAAAQNDPLIGVYRFKKGFGGRVVRYLPAYDRVLLPPLYWLWRRSTGQ
jgi:lipid II:glycine glycyltransferase (peptidoglycan interpeptide bridge formation enzyme)